MKVLIIRFDDFPYGSAPASRMLHLVKLIANTGTRVIMFARKINLDKDSYRELGEDFSSVRCYAPNNSGKTYMNALQQVIIEEKPDLAVQSCCLYGYTKVQRILKACGVPVVLNAVEWYNASNWRLAYADPRYYQFCFFWRFVFPKTDGVIGISRMICNYYQRYQNNVVRIPTITDCAIAPYHGKVGRDKIRFVFAGKLDRGKDNLDTFIQAMTLVDPKNEHFQLDIYGQDALRVKKHLGKNAELLEQHRNIIAHGRVPQQEAQDACMNSDFSVFFRLNRRSANAGFPTKLGECMTFGTPAICNDTGDISLVMKNRVNGYLLKTRTVDEIADTLRHILSLSNEERVQMRMEARKSAEAFFDYRNYKEEIQKVLLTAVEGKVQKNGSV